MNIWPLLIPFVSILLSFLDCFTLRRTHSFHALSWSASRSHSRLVPRTSLTIHPFLLFLRTITVPLDLQVGNTCWVKDRLFHKRIGFLSYTMYVQPDNSHNTLNEERTAKTHGSCVFTIRIVDHSNFQLLANDKVHMNMRHLQAG